MKDLVFTGMKNNDYSVYGNLPVIQTATFIYYLTLTFFFFF